MTVADLIGLGRELGARFTLVGLLPMAALAVFVIALLLSGAPGSAPDVDRLGDRLQGVSTAEAILLLFALLVAALITQPLQLGLVRLLEGYWGPARGHVGRERARRDKAVRQRGSGDEPVTEPAELERVVAASEVLRREFPPAAALLPTRLGNALRAAESRAGQRYGLDTVVVWPRLYPVLPADLRMLVDDHRLQLDLAARFCVVALLATAVALPLLVVHEWWLAVPAATLALAWLAYRAAVSAALAYGEALYAAFDIGRFALLEAMRLPLPADRNAERTANEELSDFLRQGSGGDFTYEHPEPAATPAGTPAAPAPPVQPATPP